MFQPFNKYKFLFLIFLFSSFLITSFNNCSDVPLVRDEESLDSSFEQQGAPPQQLIEAALAVRASSCIACHARVVGNFYTDFGYGNNYFNNKSLKADPYCTEKHNYMNKNSASYGSRWSISSIAFGSFFSLDQGHFIVPQKVSTSQWDGEAYPDGLRFIKQDLWDKLSNSPLTTSNASERAYKADSYIKEVKNMYIGAPTNDDLLLLTQKPDARLVFSNPGRSLIKIYAIGPNSTISGLNFLVNKLDQGYMANYKLNKGQVSNAQPITCKGDIVIMGGPLLLAGNDLNQNSLVTDNMGCRLYVENSVFLNDQFNIHQELGGTENLQITSTRAIFMGLGFQSINYRLFDWEGGLRSGESCAAEEQNASLPALDDFHIVKDRIEDAGPLRSIIIDFDKITSCIKTTTSSECLKGKLMVGRFDDNIFRVLNTQSDKFIPHKELPQLAINLNTVIQAEYENWSKGLSEFSEEPFKTQGVNAYLSSRKHVEYKHMILNAPQIQSRYIGKFKGLLIAEYALFAVGDFLFEHDKETFRRAKIFPLLLPKIFSTEALDTSSSYSSKLSTSSMVSNYKKNEIIEASQLSVDPISDEHNARSNNTPINIWHSAPKLNFNQIITEQSK